MRLIEVPKAGDPTRGYLTEVQSHLPFVPKRAYYIYGVPDGASRGGHAHRTQEQVFFCLQGLCAFRQFLGVGLYDEVLLDDATKGLYIGPLEWHTMTFSHGAIVLAFGSEEYDEREYIRSWQEWKRLVGRKE